MIVGGEANVRSPARCSVNTNHVRPFGSPGPEIGRDDADDAIPGVVRRDLGDALASAARFLGRTFDRA